MHKTLKSSWTSSKREVMERPPKDEEFLEKFEQYLRDANYCIMTAMDDVIQQVKDLIEFMNEHTDFKSWLSKSIAM